MNRHLYKGYKSLVGRVIKPGNHDLQPVEGMPTPNQHLGNDRITLAPSAMNRFERLGDRIELIMLSSIEQSIGEKDALTNTVRLSSLSLDQKPLMISSTSTS